MSKPPKLIVINLNVKAVQTMIDQQLYNKVGNGIEHMKRHAKSQLLGKVQVRVDIPLSPRFCLNTRKDYRRALFQAALNGDLCTLDALAGQVEVTDQLIDEEACDNALWVAVAESHSSFAIALLQTPSIQDKITLPGIKEAMKLSLEQKDKMVINALLQFVANLENAELETNFDLITQNSA